MLNSYFIFSIGQTLYGIESNAVKMAFNVPAITPLDNAPAYIAGVINFHGKVIAVAELRVLLSTRPYQNAISDALIIVEINGELMGMVADAVSDVIAIAEEQIDPPLCQDCSTPFMARLTLGMARVEDNIIRLLDPSQLMRCREGLDLQELALPESFNPTVPSSEISDDKANQADYALLQQRAAALICSTETSREVERQQIAVILLGQEYFGIDIRNVNEFARIKYIVPLPNCPAHVLGNTNLRGNILTVIDIRTVLGMPVSSFDHSAKIVVSSNDNVLVGVAVDDIDDIVEIAANEVTSLPASTHQDRLTYLIGTVGYQDRAITLLNFPVILKSRELVVGFA